MCKGNLIDTAEMYPVPSSDPAWRPGATEQIVGSWIAKNPALRKDVFLATKVSGYNPRSDTAGNRRVTLDRGGALLPNGLPEPIPARLDRESVLMACEASLKRLQTDYIGTPARGAGGTSSRTGTPGDARTDAAARRRAPQTSIRSTGPTKRRRSRSRPKRSTHFAARGRFVPSASAISCNTTWRTCWPMPK